MEFDFNLPSAFRLAQRFADLTNDMDEEVFIFACYLMELSLVDIKMNKWLPSRIAASAIYLSKKILKRDDPWCRVLAFYTGLTLTQVKCSARDLCIILN